MPSCKRMRILFVEPYDALRETMGELFEMWNYKAILAAGEDEAVAKVRVSESIRVALIEDDMRHGIDGVQIAGSLYQARRGALYIILYAADYEDALHRSRPHVGSWIWTIVRKGDTESLKEKLQEVNVLI